MLRGVDARAACARAVCGRLKAGSIRLSLGPAAKLKSGRARPLKSACNGVGFPRGLARGVEGPRDAIFSRCGSLIAIDVCAQAGVGVIGWMSGERTSSFVNAPSAERSYGGRAPPADELELREYQHLLKHSCGTIASLQNDTHTLTDTHTQRTAHTLTHMLVHTHALGTVSGIFCPPRAQCLFDRHSRSFHPSKSLAADWAPTRARGGYTASPRPSQTVSRPVSRPARASELGCRPRGSCVRPLPLPPSRAVPVLLTLQPACARTGR